MNLWLNLCSFWRGHQTLGKWFTDEFNTEKINTCQCTYVGTEWFKIIYPSNHYNLTEYLAWNVLTRSLRLQVRICQSFYYSTIAMTNNWLYNLTKFLHSSLVWYSCLFRHKHKNFPLSLYEMQAHIFRVSYWGLMFGNSVPDLMINLFSRLLKSLFVPQGRKFGSTPGERPEENLYQMGQHESQQEGQDRRFVRGFQIGRHSPETR